MVNCEICGSKNFHCINGLYFCKICDRQSFDYVDDTAFEIDTAFEENGGQNYVYGKRIHQSQNQVFSQNDKTIDYTIVEETIHQDNGRPFTSFEVFQTILKEQANALIRYGFPTVLKEKVFSLWCAYLSSIGEAFCVNSNAELNMAHIKHRDACRPTHNNMAQVKKRRKVNISQEEKQSDNEETGEEAMDELSKPKDTYSTKNKQAPNRLNMNTIISILYLAVHSTNMYYTITDIIKWINDGVIPYFNADKYLPDDMKLINKDHEIFTYLVLPNHAWLRTLSANVARFIGIDDLTFQPMDIDVLCMRYIVQLNLPGELIKLVHELISSKKPYLRFTPAHKDNKCRTVPQYESVAACYIIIVLRDLFGFHQELEAYLCSYANNVQEDLPESAAKLFNVEKWMQWATSRRNVPNFPQHNRDTQRFQDLNSTLKYFSAIAAPSSRYANATSVTSVLVNKELTRKQMTVTIEQLQSGIEELKRKHQDQPVSQHLEESFISCSDLSAENQSLDHCESSLYFEPALFSTQKEKSQPCNPSQCVSEVNFRDHSVSYLACHYLFCKEYNLIKRYKYKHVRAHVEQYIVEAEVERVVKALMSESRYAYIPAVQRDMNSSFIALFQIFSEFLYVPMKELMTVYEIIERALLYQQNHILPYDRNQLMFYGNKSQYVTID